MRTATLRWSALLLVALAAPAVAAQSLGDEFILFVDGTNVLIPETDAETVNDPAAPTSGDRVAKFNGGNWVSSGWFWSRTDGVDATASVGATYGQSDTLYFSLYSSTANAGQPGVAILISDATDDSGANDGTADLEFRLLWTIPDELHNEQWHDLAIPLPPATYDALEAARTNGELMDGAENWSYPGAWSVGGFGVGPGFGTDTSDPLWEEFDWANLYKIGPFWDNSTDNGAVQGPIYLDNVYIGGPSTSISSASEAPTAMGPITVAADGPVNAVTWATVDGVGGYKVYTSLSPIIDVEAEGVVEIARVAFDNDARVEHRYELPHPALGSRELYYAVTTLSGFGVENKDVTASTGSVSNENLAVKPYILELTNDAADAIFAAISAGTVTDDPFGSDHPVFVFDSSHRSPGDGTTEETAPEDADLSATAKIGYNPEYNEMYIYAEVTDDQVVFAPSGETGANTWGYDSFEISFGNYDVRDVVGGGLLTGTVDDSPGTLSRGEFPEYGLRITGIQNETSFRSSTWVGFSLDEDLTSSTVLETTDTGYRFLTLIPLESIQAEGDAYNDVPETTEIDYIPLSLSLNDADDAGAGPPPRESQIVWSIRPNVDGQWWNREDQWEVVAIAGLQGTSVAVEDGAEADGFALAQSAPNPTYGSVEIAFSMGAPGRATVEVFNALGQRIATIADGEYASGDHAVSFDTSSLAAGVYVYRLSAGTYVGTRRMTVVR